MILNIEYNHHLLKKAINKKSEEIEFKKGFTVGKLIDLLNRKYKLRDLIINNVTKKLKVVIFINGVNIDDLSYRFGNNDKVNFLVLVTGG